MHPNLMAYLMQTAQPMQGQGQSPTPSQLLPYLMQSSQPEQGHPSQEQVSANPQMSQGSPQEALSPFGAGSSAAIKAAKQSLGMDEEEKNRAMGMAIMHFFSNMAKPGHGDGFNGTLAAANASFLPAAEAYQKEQDRVANLNATLMNQLGQYSLQRQQMMEHQLEKQQMMQHRQSQLEEQKQHHREMMELKKLGLERKGQISPYQMEKLKLEKEKIGQQPKKIPAQVLSKINKDLEKYSAAEMEYHDLLEAEKLLKKGDPLYNPYAQGALSLIGGRPEALKNPDQAAFEQLQSDMKGQTFKRFGYRNQAEFKNIKEIDPRLGKAENEKIIEQRKKQIEPLLKKKQTLEKKYAEILGEEGIDTETESPHESAASSQAPSLKATPTDQLLARYKTLMGSAQ
jgi:hypothetical protein